MSTRQAILSASDRLICALIALLILGGTVGFGGAVWWFAPVLSIGTFLLVFTKLAQILLTGRMPVFKSPLTLLGMLSLVLAVCQLAPLPAPLARCLSPTAHNVYACGFLPALVRADAADVAIPQPPSLRSPASLDRSATLRWLVTASACLGIFWVLSHFTDRLERLYLVWGLVIAGFLLNAALAIVQVISRSNGLYGVLLPGTGPSWGPTLDDALVAPVLAVLKNLPDTAATATLTPAVMPRAVLAPTLPFLFGTMMGGSGAFLASGTLALPLASAVVLHLVSPRGSRESLPDRLGPSSLGSLVILVLILMFPAAILIGLVAGWFYCSPLVLGLAIVLIPAIVRSNSRNCALGLLFLLFTGLGMGVALQTWWSAILSDRPPVEPPDLVLARSLWSASLHMIQEFPLVGSGLGSFPTIFPYFKTIAVSSTTAMSTVLQWGVEAGAAGLGLLVVAVLWSLIRLPAGLKRVSRIDRSLAHGLVGAVVGMSLLALVHWTMELPAIAISASALGGVWNRWLAGGTDLFLERG